MLIEIYKNFEEKDYFDTQNFFRAKKPTPPLNMDILTAKIMAQSFPELPFNLTRYRKKSIPLPQLWKQIIVVPKIYLV